MTFSVHGLGVNTFYADINEVPQAVSRSRLECGPTAAPSTPTAPSHPRAPGAISLRHGPSSAAPGPIRSSSRGSALPGPLREASTETHP